MYVCWRKLPITEVYSYNRPQFSFIMVPAYIMCLLDAKFGKFEQKLVLSIVIKKLYNIQTLYNNEFLKVCIIIQYKIYKEICLYYNIQYTIYEVFLIIAHYSSYWDLCFQLSQLA